MPRQARDEPKKRWHLSKASAFSAPRSIKPNVYIFQCAACPRPLCMGGGIPRVLREQKSPPFSSINIEFLVCVSRACLGKLNSRFRPGTVYRKGGFSAAGSSIHLRAGLEIVGLASARVVQFKATCNTYIRPTPAQKRRLSVHVHASACLSWQSRHDFHPKPETSVLPVDTI